MIIFFDVLIQLWGTVWMFFKKLIMILFIKLRFHQQMIFFLWSLPLPVPLIPAGLILESYTVGPITLSRILFSSALQHQIEYLCINTNNLYAVDLPLYVTLCEWVGELVRKKSWRHTLSWDVARLMSLKMCWQNSYELFKMATPYATKIYTEKGRPNFEQITSTTSKSNKVQKYKFCIKRPKLLRQMSQFHPSLAPP